MAQRDTTFRHGGRQFAVDRDVFDPVRHLSGIVFADFLATQRWDGQRVLELGTGCGVLAAVLVDGGAHVTATDVSADAVACATANLSDTSVDVLHSDLFNAVPDERFDIIVMNPPYEVGRSRSATLRSPDVLSRLSAQWEKHGDELIIAFPTDSTDILIDAGFSLALVERIPTGGRELGVFRSR